MRVDLPRGDWADLRDNPAQMPNKYREPVVRAVYEARAQATVDDQGNLVEYSMPYEAVNAMMRAAAVALVESWSYALPVPSEDASQLDEIPGDAYDVLVAKAWEAWPSDDAPLDGSSPTSS